MKAALVILLIGLGFAGFGAYIFFVEAGNSSDEADRIESLPGGTMSEFRDVPLNDTVAVTGTIIPTDPINESAVADYDFIVYQVHRWEVSTDDGETEGTWYFVSSDMVRFRLQLSDLLLRIEKADIGEIEGELHRHVQRSSGGESATYEDSSLPEGSRLYGGLMSGDTVTVVGTRTGEETILPEKLYGGTREALVDDLRGEAAESQIVGGIFAIVGVVVAVGAGIAAIRAL
jgi:hypothetical protein